MLSSWDLCKICKPIVESSFLDIKNQNQKEEEINYRGSKLIIKETKKEVKNLLEGLEELNKLI